MTRDHGGGLDGAIARHGGVRGDWLDLSTGINPIPYPLGEIGIGAWTALPDQGAQDALIRAARRFWQVPEDATILAAPGASSLIARLPGLASPGQVHIPAPTYNEHAAGFAAHGWEVSATAPARTDARVLVHPNNPTGHFHAPEDLGAPLTVIDESFCDVAPTRSLIAHATRSGHIILKSFGKFWGLAGLRLGFAIGPAPLVAQLGEMLGPWPVSGPALAIGARALADQVWAQDTRIRLDADAARLDALMQRAGATVAGGTSLFRLYRVENASDWQDRLASHRILGRIFPYADDLIRLGLPTPPGWAQLEAAL